jgi:hypothetical protein
MNLVKKSLENDERKRENGNWIEFVVARRRPSELSPAALRPARCLELRPPPAPRRS